MAEPGETDLPKSHIFGFRHFSGRSPNHSDSNGTRFIQIDVEFGEIFKEQAVRKYYVILALAPTNLKKAINVVPSGALASIESAQAHQLKLCFCPFCHAHQASFHINWAYDGS